MAELPHAQSSTDLAVPSPTADRPWTYEPWVDAPLDPPPERAPGPMPAARRGSGLRIVGGLLALTLVAGGSALGGAQWALSRDGDRGVTTASPVSVDTSRSAPTEQLAKVAAAVQPSVVSITVSSPSGSGEGSGVVIRSDGTIVTNNHVVADAADGAGSLTVKLSDGRSATATIVGRDPSVDLAVIRAQGVSGLTPATFGSGASVHVGDTVLALGSPLGLDGSVSAGIVSALHRTVQIQDERRTDPLGRSPTSSSAVGDAIQTDAAINPGNSGGPLVDVSGRVIGITTAIATLGTSSGQSGSIGLGFAIPVDQVKYTTDALIAGRTPTHAVLGVQISDATSTDGGALIASVTTGGAAATAGVRAGDVITKFDGVAVGSASELSGAIRARRPGSEVVVTYRRNGQEHTATVTLGSAG